MAQYGLTSKGPNPKRLDVILEQMHDSMTKRLGVNTKQNPQSLLNHLLTNVADRIAELWEYGTDVYFAMYPTSAEGVNLDNAAQFGGAIRALAAKSYYSILCTGLDGTIVPAGTIIASDTNPATNLTNTEDGIISRSNFNKAVVVVTSTANSSPLSVALNGTLYTIPNDSLSTPSELILALSDTITDKTFNISAEGEQLVIEAVDPTSINTMVLSENLTTQEISSVLTFATEEYGDIFLPNGVISKIVKSVPGMTKVINVGSYIAGRDIESDIEFRKSYIDKIFSRSSNMLESIQSAILENVQGVLSCAAYENDTNTVDGMGRYPHSIEVVVDGGDETEIAQQILEKKSGGISTYGSIEKTVPGIYGENIVIRFNRPTYVKVWFHIGVTLNKHTNPAINYVELIKNQVLEKMDALGAGDDVLPQTFHIEVPGIDYVDIRMGIEESGEKPSEYPNRSITISEREKAVTDENRIEVVIDG